MSEWISVKDRVPEGVTPEFDGVLKASERVAVCVNVKGYSDLYGISFGQCLIYNNGWEPGWRADGWNGDYVVTHWMPIPPHPKQGTK